MERKTMPAYVIKLGKIQANVWANETKHGKRFNVTAFRMYLANGEWKRSDSFGRDECQIVAEVFHKAYAWIEEQSHVAKRAERIQQCQNDHATEQEVAEGYP